MKQLITAILFAVALLSLQGCPGLTEVKPVYEAPGEKQLTKANQAQISINEVRALLTGFNQAIAQNVRAKVWTKPQAQGYLDQSKALRSNLDKVQAMLDLGDISNANTQRALIMAGILSLQRRAAATGRGE